ncbi:hypothetical protein Tco_0060554 [Tanacetum coccineum]
MSSPKFAEMHNVVAFLEKPVESDGFAEIIDFLKASSVHYALTVNPIIYTSCTEQFWAKAKVQTVNGVRQLQALVDKKRVIITESSIRSDLHLEDAGGTDCLLTATIFEELACMGYEKPSQKHSFLHSGKVPQDETKHEESVPTPSNDIQPSGEDSMQLKDLMVLCTKLQAQVLDLEKAKDAQAKEIAALKKRVQRLERKKKSKTSGLKRLKKVGMSRRVESSEDQESLGDHEDASKQGRSIKDIDADAEVTMVNETQERNDEDLMFDTGVLDDDEVFVDVTTSDKDDQSRKLDDSTAGEAITTASVEGSVAPTTIEEITLAQTLIQIKAAKPKIEPSEFRTPQEAQPSITKDKGKEIMIEPKVSLKRKDQVAPDEDLARNIQAQLEAELIEEEKLARKQEE